MLRWIGKRWSEVGGNAARPAATGEGGIREWKRLESGWSHCSCRGWSASGSLLVTDWSLLLPPCVKTQMACFGWSKTPVSYSVGSAQPPRDSHCPLGGWVSRWGGVGRELDWRVRSASRGGEERVSESGSLAGVLPPSSSFGGVGLPAALSASASDWLLKSKERPLAIGSVPNERNHCAGRRGGGRWYGPPGGPAPQCLAPLPCATWQEARAGGGGGLPGRDFWVVATGAPPWAPAA